MSTPPLRTSVPLQIPVFVPARPARIPPGNPTHLDRCIVAAIRYDYDIALMPMIEVCRKYRAFASPTAARDIMNRITHRDVRPKRIGPQALNSPAYQHLRKK